MPRFLFVDYPLGNPMGRPYDEAEQAELFTLSLDLFERAFVPRTTVQAPVVWDEAETWRANFMKIDEDVRDQLVAEGEERRRKQAEAKETGKARQA